MRFDELARYLELNGVELIRVRGSRHVFLRGAVQFTVPLRRPQDLAVYVREALQRTFQ